MYCPNCEEKNVKIGGNSISIGGSGSSVVVNDGEVYIDGERCYPKGLIEELDRAHQMLELCLEPHAFKSGDRSNVERAEKVLERIRTILGLS
jgi:hypothetical protein